MDILRDLHAAHTARLNKLNKAINSDKLKDTPCAVSYELGRAIRNFKREARGQIVRVKTESEYRENDRLYYAISHPSTTGYKLVEIIEAEGLKAFANLSKLLDYSLRPYLFEVAALVSIVLMKGDVINEGLYELGKAVAYYDEAIQEELDTAPDTLSLDTFTTLAKPLMSIADALALDTGSYDLRVALAKFSASL